ncbi:class I SAM-dependent RNA methyltransferase [Candidatus Bathyarchaeota archaeon]|nr:MAG: class I SAM-dependent RNA methyltransferase [Candidatus Bathyarchaeota archaeon]
MRLFATTVPGAEDLAAQEVEALLGCRPEPGVGRIYFEGPREAVYLLNLRSRTLYKVMIELCRGRFEGLEGLYRLARSLDYGWVIGADQSFAIRSERYGEHDFTSVDVSRVVGQAVIDSYKESRGVRLRVDLEKPDVEIEVLVRGEEFLMGVNTTGRSLHRRGYRVYEHPAALKPTIASAMILWSGWTPERSLLDPMCGGGTIPIEAALMARNIAPNGRREDFSFLKLRLFNREEFEEERRRTLEAESGGCFPIHGMERSRRHLRGALRNAEEAGVRDTIHFILGDATRWEDYPQGDLEYVIVNPPYGIRMVPGGSPKRLYVGFLEALKGKGPGATLVLITAASRRFREAVEEVGVEVVGERRVMHGELTTTLFKCRIP